MAHKQQLSEAAVPVNLLILQSLIKKPLKLQEDSHEEGEDSGDEGLMEEFQDEPVSEEDSEAADEESPFPDPGKEIYDDLFDNPEEDLKRRKRIPMKTTTATTCKKKSYSTGTQSTASGPFGHWDFNSRIFFPDKNNLK